nr:integrase, catalytic region, zinc finger, CCHC-type, peptidase aspartic, catalytic [Tanacetum cinerariifolium]
MQRSMVKEAVKALLRGTMSLLVRTGGAIEDEKLCGGTEDFSSVSGNNTLRRTLDRGCTDIKRFSVVGALVNGSFEIPEDPFKCLEDTLEIAEITRKKMIAKMNDPECVTRKVKIAPHDYSKENFLATFTPQKQLTIEQIFWSNDLMKLKSEALKERTNVCRPIKALTVYPLNIHATLVPHGIQKALTKEMKDVFEELEAEVAQYAVDRKHDVIERKNILIANDNLIAKCLIKEVFSVAKNSELNIAQFTKMTVAHTAVKARCLAFEAELANLRDKHHHDNQKELINHFSKLEVNYLNLQLKYQNLKDSIGNNPPTPDKDTPDFDSVFVIGKMQASLQGKDNVIRQLRKKLSQLQVTRSDTDRTLQVQTADSQITKLTEQVTDLQAQNSLFRAKNDKIKQHYKELYDSIKITRAKHLDQVTKLTTENVNLKTSVSKDTVSPQISARDKHAIDVEPIVPCLRHNKDAHLDYLRHLKESVETIRDIVEDAKVVRPLDRSLVSACRYSQELLEYAIGTCPQGSHQRAKRLAHILLIRKKQVLVAIPSDKSDRVNGCLNASGSQPKSNVKPNRISPAKVVNKLPVEDQPRTNKSHLRTSNHVDSSRRLKRTVVQIVLWYLDSGCSKHMTGDHSRLMNFVKKFIGTVRFRNDHFGVIIGYEDYVIGDSVISRVYYVEGLGHNLFSVEQFCDFDLEVAF